MVALLIFSIGLLGLAMLQATGLKLLTRKERKVFIKRIVQIKEPQQN